MTASPGYQDLCYRLVEDHYGDFYSTIFKSLIGSRLTAPQVAQRCHLPLRQAKAGLAGLLQLNLLHHHMPRDAATVYSANLTNAYNLIRAGKLIAAARERLGEQAASIVEIACELNFATVSELRDRVLQMQGSQSAEVVEQSIDLLIRENVLVYLRTAHLSEEHDVRRQVELSLLSPAAISKLTGTKAKAEHAYNVEREYEKLKNTSQYEFGYANESWPKTDLHGQSNGLHKQMMRRELVQPNYHKVVAIAQGAVAADLALKMHSKRAASVIGAAVRQAADSDRWSRLPPMHIHKLDVRRIQEECSEQRSLLLSENATNANGINGKTNGHHYSEFMDEELSMAEVNLELMYLTEGEFHFIHGEPDAWMVDKGALNDWLKKEETLRVLDSRLEPPAPRILRILVDKGKLEERTLQEVGLLGAKELRQCLSLLKQMGYLDLQEVPRNAQRMPNQTVFLWAHEAERVHSLVLESVYTSLTKLIQMLELEREQIANTLSKIEREDVKGKEQEMLPEAEYVVLQRFQRLEQWVWTEIHRLDTTVAILRDI